MGWIDGVSEGVGALLLAMAAAGIAYLAIATFLLARQFGSAKPAPRSIAPVTILKPLYGAEPCLVDNLATFLTQDHNGPVQLLCGVHRADDPAVAAVEALRRRFPDARIDLVIDGTVHGANGKVGNLVNMQAAIAHDIVLLSDSDIAVAPDYVARVVAALEQPGVGVVSCPYAGRGDAGFWSRMEAANISYQFLPNLLFGAATGMARPCMGSTIALRHETLDKIGGFQAFADILADDHAIGAAVAGLGLTVAVPPVLVVHACVENNLASLVRHELRWAATVRDLALAGHIGSVVSWPLPLAVLGALLLPGPGLIAVAAALVLRLIMKRVIDRALAQLGAPIALPFYWLALRDILGFGIFLASLFVSRVDWRGTRLRMAAHGRIEAEMESRL